MGSPPGRRHEPHRRGTNPPPARLLHPVFPPRLSGREADRDGRAAVWPARQDADRCGLMAAYYNEWEPFAAQWLRNLISAGHIPAGDVDERSITEVQPDDLRGYRQAHFFAGLAGWAYAARLAGLADDFPIWTGSPPCQPHTRANPNRRGLADKRHLWPELARLVRACRPPVLFGEQSADAIANGWLDEVASDLEGAG